MLKNKMEGSAGAVATPLQVKTRNILNCVVFGAPKELSELVLPTYENVMQLYLWIKNDLKPTASVKEPTVTVLK